MAAFEASRGISSRLLTMKFMQQGIASQPTSPASASHPGANKRRRTTEEVSGGAAKPLYDEEAVRRALEDEEQKRQAAIRRQAQALGDSHWVLDGDLQVLGTGSDAKNSLTVVQVGFAQVDDDNYAVSSESRKAGQSKIQRYNMDDKSLDKSKNNSSDSDSGSSDSDDSTDPRSGSRVPQTSSKISKKRARSQVSREKGYTQPDLNLSGAKKPKKVKLNKLTSISSAGSIPHRPRGKQGQASSFNRHFKKR